MTGRTARDGWLRKRAAEGPETSDGRGDIVVGSRNAPSGGARPLDGRYSTHRAAFPAAASMF